MRAGEDGRGSRPFATALIDWSRIAIALAQLTARVVVSSPSRARLRPGAPRPEFPLAALKPPKIPFTELRRNYGAVSRAYARTTSHVLRRVEVPRSHTPPGDEEFTHNAR